LTSDRRAHGSRVEQAAADYLEREGLALLARNVTCRHGEIDLVMREGDTLVFVEVRYRRGESHGGALESVDPYKQARVVAAARWYLARQRDAVEPPCRFDVVAVSGEPPYRMTWIADAFEAED
jgi:putative endonuclease